MWDILISPGKVELKENLRSLIIGATLALGLVPNFMVEDSAEGKFDDEMKAAIDEVFLGA